MYLQLCTEAQLDDIYAEFGATKESVHRDVQYLKQWLQKQPHLPNVEDDEWLSNFLLRCKNSVEKTKNRLDFYFSTKAILKEWFSSGQNMATLIKQLYMFVAIPMPKLTPDGNRVVIIHLLEHSSSELPSGDTILLGMQFLYEYLLKRDQVRGITFMYDGRNISMSFIAMMLQCASKHILVHSKINPVRYDKVYLLNFPSFAQPIISFATQFIKKEADKLVLWKKDILRLNEVLPRSCLPLEYGGSEPSLRELKSLFQEEIRIYLPEIEKHNTLIADLSKKPGHVEKIESLYGVEGSFRKLSVD